MLAQVPLGQALLDSGLPSHQPVQRRIQLVLIDRAQPQRHAQGGHGALGRQRAGSGQFRLRVDDPGDDQRHHEIPHPAGGPRDQGVQVKLPHQAEHGGDVAVREAAHAGDGVVGLTRAVVDPKIWTVG